MLETVVIGAGIVGACTARALQLAGHDVVIVDQDDPGHGCSFGNAGVISTAASSVQPPGPRLLRQVPKMLMDRESVVQIRLSYLLRFAPWLLAWARGCTEAEQQRTAVAMAGLLARSTTAYDRLLAGTQAASLIRKNGSLGLFRTTEIFEKDRWRRDINASLGATQVELSREELKQMESSITDTVEHAVYFPTAYSTPDPLLLTRTIVDDVVANGGSFRKARVDGFVASNGSVSVLKTDTGELTVDKLVVCAGAFSGRLVKPLGIKVLLDTERGYHVDLPETPTRLTRPGLHYEHAYGVNPTRTGVRFAGTVEFGGLDAPMNEKRALALWRNAGPVLKETADLDAPKMTTWMGRRPTMPDFKPVIDAAPGLKNCWFAFGHQHLGLTLAARTGMIVSDLVAGRKPDVDMQPFRADRF